MIATNEGCFGGDPERDRPPVSVGAFVSEKETPEMIANSAGGCQKSSSHRGKTIRPRKRNSTKCLNVITRNRKRMLRAGIKEEILTLLEPFGEMFGGKNILEDYPGEFLWNALTPLPIPEMFCKEWGLNVREDCVEIKVGNSNPSGTDGHEAIRLEIHPEWIVKTLTTIRDLPTPATAMPEDIPGVITLAYDFRVFQRVAAEIRRENTNIGRLMKLWRKECRSDFLVAMLGVAVKHGVRGAEAALARVLRDAGRPFTDRTGNCEPSSIRAFGVTDEPADIPLAAEEGEVGK